jgi:predicted TIM-barrel fold metal-dependent hydrolase
VKYLAVASAVRHSGGREVTTIEESGRSSIADTLERLQVHDVDSHISEPSNLWTSRMASKWGDAIPQLRFDADTGMERWFIDGHRGPLLGESALMPYDEETAAGASDPHARLAWMDAHGIFSQVLYPNILGFFPRAFMQADAGFGVDCVRAYNDFQTEFAAVDPARLIPATYLPWWDLDAACTELGRCHVLGHRSVNLPWELEQVGLPGLRDDFWEPLLRSTEERGMTVNFHVGFNTEDLDFVALMARSKLDLVTESAKFFTGNIRCIAELIMGRICHRYPTLKFVSVESGMGFIPFLIESLEWQFLNANLFREHPDMLLPSEYFRRQIYGTFWFERDVAALAHLYPDNFMFETDYPHASSLTPADSLPYVTSPRQTIVNHLADLPEELVVKLLRDNAAAVYQLESQ